MTETAAWLEAFGPPPGRGGAEPAWLGERRREALARFTALGFPSRRDESWKYTNAQRIAAARYGRLGAATLPAAALAEIPLLPKAGPLGEGGLWTFVNGRYAGNLSRPAQLPGGAVVASYGELLRDGDGRLEPRGDGFGALGDCAFALLAGAHFEDGLFVHLPPRCILEAPLTALFLTTAAAEPAANHVRLTVEAGAESRALLYEIHASLGQGAAYFKNVLAEISLGEGASLTRIKAQDEAAGATHLATVATRAAAGAHFESLAVSLGADLAREELRCDLYAGSQCQLSGLYLALAERHVDHQVRVDHREPRARSRQAFRGLLTGKSRGVFGGRVVVHPDAQQSDASQRSENLLLSERAEVDTKPQLEIYADDVKCSHGATVGHLDADQLFYLRARGLGETAARALLVRGFATAITAEIPDAALREAVEAEVAGRSVGADGAVH